MSMRCACLLLTAGLVACAPEVPRSLSSGFDPARDSLADPNFAIGHDDAYLDAALLQRMFGDGVCRSGASPCQLTLAAEEWRDRANDSMGGGRCEGFAMLSSLLFTKDLDVKTLGAETPRALMLDGNTAYQRELAYWQATQLVTEVASKTTKAYAAKDVMPALVAALSPGSKDPVRIGIVKKVGTRIAGGHALTPISFTRRADGAYLVRVYDSNTPHQERQLLIDVPRNRWEYEASTRPGVKSSLFVGDAKNRNPLYLSPARPRLGTLPCPFCTDDAVNVRTEGGLELQASREGASATVKDGEVTVTGGATVLPLVSTLEDEDAAFVASVPGTGATQVKLSGALEGLGGLSVVSKSVVAGARGLSIPLDVQDTLSASTGDTRYENASHTSLTISTAIETTAGNVLRVEASIQGASDVVETTASPMGVVSVKAEGAAGTDLSLLVKRTAPDGTVSVGQVVVHLGADAGVVDLRAATAGWSGEQALPATLTEDGVSRAVSNACEDGVKNGSESDVDCGGMCLTTCATGATCTRASDCASGACSLAGRCVSTTCEDGRLSGDESDVDCGGSCQRCATSQACQQAADCLSNVCSAQVCRQPSIISVTVVGLPAGDLLTLQSGGADELDVAQSGTYQFLTPVFGPYAVTLKGQPNASTCSVTNGSGVATGAPVNVNVVCAPGFLVSGTVTGLPMGETVQLSLRGAPLDVAADGPFTFTNRVSGMFEVTVAAQPSSVVCRVMNGAGVATADVTGVDVRCSQAFTIGGTVSGLPGGTSVVLTNNGESLSVSTSPFVFVQPATTYAVAVFTQPPGIFCRVDNGAGTATQNVTTVDVVCVPSGVADPAFQSGGVLRSASFAMDSALVDVALSPDDAQVYLGYEAQMAIGNEWLLVRATPAGTLDNAFGANGILRMAQAGAFVRPRALRRTADGSYLLIGDAEPPDAGSGSELTLVKVTAAGAVDLSFGLSGRASFGSASGEDTGWAVHAFPDGTALAIGLSGAAPGTRVVSRRLTATGAQAVGYADAGVFFGGPANLAATGLSADVDALGRAWIAGTAGADTFVMRLTAAGVPDSTFGANGIAVFDLSTASLAENAVGIRVDGTTALVLSSVEVSGMLSRQGRVARVTEGGTLESSFGTSGSVGLSGSPRALAARGAFIYVADEQDVVRLSASGVLDATYGPVRPFTAGMGRHFQLAVDAQGRIVVAGQESFSTWAAARLTP